MVAPEELRFTTKRELQDRPLVLCHLTIGSTSTKGELYEDVALAAPDAIEHLRDKGALRGRHFLELQFDQVLPCQPTGNRMVAEIAK